MTIDTILISTDGSDPAEAAARSGFELAAQLDAAVHLVSVADVGIASSASSVGDIARVRERLCDRAETDVSRLESRRP